MEHYPLISIVITADCSLPQIAQSMQSLAILKYPKDRLEFLMIMPPLRPIPETTPISSQLSVIQFDSGMDWNKEDARFEGLCLAKGRYIQFIDGCLKLETKWFKEALTNFVKQEIVGITGSISKSDIKYVTDFGKNGRHPDKSLLLNDGLFDRNLLTHLLQNGNGSHFDISKDQLIQVSTKMADDNGNGRHPNHYIKSKVSSHKLRILTKHIFVQNHA